jgi:hypothetical protein
VLTTGKEAITMHHHLITIAAAAAREPLPPVAAELLGGVFIGLCIFVLFAIIRAITG